MNVTFLVNTEAGAIDARTLALHLSAIYPDIRMEAAGISTLIVAFKDLQEAVDNYTALQVIEVACNTGAIPPAYDDTEDYEDEDEDEDDEDDEEEE